jgi:23S rRNA (adenine2503-C2)-methyltransferase
MPINRKYPIEKLIAACKPLAGRPQTPLTIEYMLIEGVNDSMRQSRELAGICRALDAKVNLIALNPALSGKFTVSPQERVLQFQAELRKHEILAFVRRSRGRDIDAACGQLRASSRRRSGQSD